MDSDLHTPSVDVPAPAGGPWRGAVAVPGLAPPVTPTLPVPPGTGRSVTGAPRPVPDMSVPGPRPPGLRWPLDPPPASADVSGRPPGTPADAAGRASGESGPSRWRWWLEWLAVVAVALVLALGVRSYVAQMFYIPSGSMLPTLQIGDRIVVDKLSYHLHGIQRGDVVVFRRPPREQAAYSDLVKRVIGLPGDTVASVGGRVYIDGRPLAEPWLPHPAPMTSPSPVDQPFSLNHPFTVPAGQYFVMGDNRTNSEDSRYFGPISSNLVVGRMAFVAWPLDDSGWLVVLMAAAAGLVVAIAVVALRPPAAARAPRPAPRRPAGPERPGRP